MCIEAFLDMTVQWPGVRTPRTRIDVTVRESRADKCQPSTQWRLGYAAAPGQRRASCRSHTLAVRLQRYLSNPFGHCATRKYFCSTTWRRKRRSGSRQNGGSRYGRTMAALSRTHIAGEDSGRSGARGFGRARSRVQARTHSIACERILRLQRQDKDKERKRE